VFFLIAEETVLTQLATRRLRTPQESTPEPS
jgi:hypothetical protein